MFSHAYIPVPHLPPPLQYYGRVVNDGGGATANGRVALRINNLSKVGE